MTTTHTPGPWTLGEKRDSCRRVNDPEGFGIVSVIATDEQSEANAALIAAAPELLAALRKLEALVDGWENTLTEKAGAVVSAHLATARAAIAKAEGQK